MFSHRGSSLCKKKKELDYREISIIRTGWEHENNERIHDNSNLRKN